MRIKHGTVNADTGLVFWSYIKDKEYWITASDFEKRRQNARRNAVARYWREPDAHRAKQREWHHANKDAKHRAYRNWAEKNKARIRNSRITKMYGITSSDYQRMMAEQGFACAICKQPETRLDKNGLPRDLCIDHCHSTKVVRGLLCVNCNVAIGKLKDDPEIMASAIAYVSKHKPAAMGGVSTQGMQG